MAELTQTDFRNASRTPPTLKRGLQERIHYVDCRARADPDLQATPPLGVRPFTKIERDQKCNGCTTMFHADTRSPPELRDHHVRWRSLTPHVHVRMGDGREALIVIESLAVLSGSIKPRELAEALAWGSQNTTALAAKWKELNP